MDSTSNDDDERKLSPKEEEEEKQEQSPPTQAELDAQSKRRAAGRATAPASAPGAVSSSTPAPTKGRPTAAGAGTASRAAAAAEASRQAVERNMQERDSLAKRRATARNGPATTPGVVMTRPDPPQPVVAASRAHAAATVRAPPTAGSRRVEQEEAPTTSYSAPPADSIAAAAAAVAPLASLNVAFLPRTIDLEMEVADAEQSEIDKAVEEAQNKEPTQEIEAEAEVAPVVSEPEHYDEEAPAVYPGVVDPSSIGDVIDSGIEAFVADTVVDATGVAVVMSEKEEEEFEQSRRKKYLCYGAIVLVIVAVSIVVPVVLLVGGKEKTIVVEQPPSIAPSMAPSRMPSSAPTTSIFSQLLSILGDLPVTAEGLFDDRNAPQYLAALWLADEDEFLTTSGLALDDPKVIQRYALATFYYSTGGNNWKLCGRSSPSCGEIIWLTDVDECTWFAVSCEDGVVTQINFPATGNDLIGEMPAELSLFTGLKRFLAPENSLKGDLDVAFGSLSALQTLAVPDNRLAGTFPMGILEKNSDLGFLNIGGNQFAGPLPAGIAGATKLSDLQLTANSFSGTIPSELGGLSLLVNFEIQGNKLVGEVPDEIFSLTKLQTMSIRDNTGINGTINPLVAQLTSLSVLQLGVTGLGGTIPSQMFALTDLTEMNLEGANFIGTIPENFRLLNASLMDLFLNDNQFTGPVPVAFDHLTALETLQIQGNQLTGSISAAVCAERGLRFQQLATLIVDCVIDCDCCDNCEE